MQTPFEALVSRKDLSIFHATSYAFFHIRSVVTDFSESCQTIAIDSIQDIDTRFRFSTIVREEWYRRRGCICPCKCSKTLKTKVEKPGVLALVKASANSIRVRGPRR